MLFRSTPSLPVLYSEGAIIPKPPAGSSGETSITPASPLARLAAVEPSEYEPASVPEPVNVFGLGAIAMGLLLKKTKSTKA